MNRLLAGLCGLLFVQGLQAAAEHDHARGSTVYKTSDLPTMIHAGEESWIAGAGFERLEWQQGRDDDAHGAYWDLQASLARDLDRFRLTSEGEADHGQAHDSELQLLYSRAFSPFWDVQFGWHSQLEPARRDYLLIGLFGLAPWYVDIDSYVLLGDDGALSAQFEAAYELKLSRHWLLMSDLELTAHARHDAVMMAGSGLAESEFSLRIGYERLRKLVPYLGVEWWRSFGETRDRHEMHGQAASEWRMVAGIHIWY